MACAACLQMRHGVIRVVLGQRVADKLVPWQAKAEPPPNAPKSTETVLRRNITIKAKHG
jgi:hypothetical protein